MKARITKEGVFEIYRGEKHGWLSQTCKCGDDCKVCGINCLFLGPCRDQGPHLGYALRTCLRDLYFDDFTDLAETGMIEGGTDG